MKLLKEPLLHFLVMGGALFALWAFINPQSGTPTADKESEIVVTSGNITHIVTLFQRTWQRPPTQQELKSLVDDYVREEVYSREARKLGLDVNDTIIRRRLKQKMDFILEDLTTPEPTDEQLQAYLETNEETFQTDPRYSLQQIYINLERHDDPRSTAENLLARLVSDSVQNTDNLGDYTMLPATINDLSSSELSKTFGQTFVENIASLPLGEWTGPIRSSFGFHLVKLSDKKVSRSPALSEIRAQVAQRWAQEQRELTRKAMDAELLESYEVTIDWPQIQQFELAMQSR